MRLLNDLEFYASEGWANFSRSKGTTFVSIFIIAVSMAIITIFSTFFANVSDFLKDMKRKPVVSVYLKKDAGKMDIAILKNKLELFKGISDLRFISSEEGLKILYKRFSHLKGVDAEIGTNPVPDAFVFKIDGKSLPELKKFLKNYSDIVDEVYTPYELFDKIEKITKGFSVLALILISVLIISSIITIYNVIKITIVSRKEDIAIMQLVGANMKYIRMPFVFEGILQGFFGGILGIILGDFAVYYICSHFFSGAEIFAFLKHIALLPVWVQIKLLVLSVFFGILGAVLASLQIEYT